MQSFDIKSCMKDKVVLISGATGFIGKVLVEKLLRDCSDISQIYVMLRSKNGNDVNVRFDRYKENIIFDHIKEKKPHLMEKLLPVRSDLTENGMGMEKNVYEMLCNSVHIIYHCAASVRFDDPLKTAMQLNVLGTSQLLELAENAKNLKAFVHVSTAFSNVQVRTIKEDIYKPLYDHVAVIQACTNNDEKFLAEAEKEILKMLPNTYVYSKNVAENVVNEAKDRIPVSLVRPSVVCPAHRDPYPGWVDSINGPVSVLTGASTGLLRSVHGSGNLKPDLLPVDFAVNTIIAAAVQRIRLTENGENKFPIINCTTSSEMPITWDQFLEIGRDVYEKYPSRKTFWYPGGRMYKSYIMFMMAFMFTQFIPAVVCDSLLTLIGRKRWLVKTQKKIFNNLKLFDYFLQVQWTWENDNLLQLYQEMSLEDKYTFNFDAKKIDYSTYIANWIIGARKFILKQSDDSLPQAKIRHRILYYIDFATKVALIGLLDFVLRKLSFWEMVVGLGGIL